MRTLTLADVTLTANPDNAALAAVGCTLEYIATDVYDASDTIIDGCTISADDDHTNAYACEALHNPDFHNAEALARAVTINLTILRRDQPMLQLLFDIRD